MPLRLAARRPAPIRPPARGPVPDAPRAPVDAGRVLRRASGGLLRASDVLGLQRTLGNGAAARVVASHRAPEVQRMTVGGRRVRPYGRDGTELWELARRRLFELGLSPHGARKQFLAFARADVDHRDVSAFLEAFGDAALAEVKRAEAEKDLPRDQRTRAWTRPLKLSRPAWLKEQKDSAEKGQDIRHVVRNANIRNALMAEYRLQMQTNAGGALAEFQRLAEHLGLDPRAGHPWELLTRIYNAAYLNPGNLFPGPGAINRVIGLTADELWRNGAELTASLDWATPELIERVYDRAAYLISAQSDATERQADRMGPLVAAEFLTGLEDFFDTVTDWLIDREDEFMERARASGGYHGVFAEGGVTVAEIGQDLLSLSANFGFDVPIREIGSEHMQVLLRVEEFLSGYQGGQIAQLAQALGEFMQLRSILRPADT